MGIKKFLFKHFSAIFAYYSNIWLQSHEPQDLLACVSLLKPYSSSYLLKSKFPNIQVFQNGTCASSTSLLRNSFKMELVDSRILSTFLGMHLGW